MRLRSEGCVVEVTTPGGHWDLKHEPRRAIRRDGLYYTPSALFFCFEFDIQFDHHVRLVSRPSSSSGLSTL